MNILRCSNIRFIEFTIFESDIELKVAQRENSLKA